jgi:hypothetical protein
MCYRPSGPDPVKLNETSGGWVCLCGLLGFDGGCPMTSNFPFCQLVVLDWRRLPLNFL